MILATFIDRGKRIFSERGVSVKTAVLWMAGSDEPNTNDGIKA